MSKELLFSFVLSIAVVGSVIWIADRPIKKNHAIGQTQEQPKESAANLPA